MPLSKTLTWKICRHDNRNLGTQNFTLIKLCVVPFYPKMMLDEPLPLDEQKSKEDDVIMPITIYLPDKTWIELEQASKFQIFMKEYIDLLQNNLEKVEVKSHSRNSFFYTCGQPHDLRNLSWQPFKLLSRICKKYDYDPLIASDIIEERIHKRLECECQIIDNQAQHRRNDLINNFGADLGVSGRREFDIF